jgi:hypothetical protein
MKTLICAALFVFGAATVSANSIAITFDQPFQTGYPGATLQFFGTITNLSGSTVYLNSDDITIGGLSLIVNDLFGNVPILLAPSGQTGDSSGDIELFDVLVSNPLLDAGTFPGTYTLVGGADSASQDIQGSSGFSVGTVPEPSSILLLLGVALSVPALRNYRRGVKMPTLKR